MEQGQCRMWAKRKYSMTSNLTSTTNPSYDDSWEEQAFAEDASGAMGGCTWPPRSYSCSFCRREFRSAQALGGHMNVHRRDRARLKQPSSPPNEILYPDLETPHQNPVQNPFTSSPGYLYPSSVCGLAYNTNPNSNPAVPASSSSPSPSKALAPTINENCSEEYSLIQPFTSSILQRVHHKASPVNSSKSWSNFAEDRNLQKFDIDPESINEKVSEIADSGCRSKLDNDRSDVAVSLNLVVCRASVPSVEFETNKEEATSCKRRRLTDASSVPFFTKSNSIDRRHLQSKMLDTSPSSIEELDLELRLGHRPKV
ncbi:hypothetical protein L6164_003403 [Bauhinia variegata]|uniref:Uncharacterized protein n=1 Tax=Bauhinia variegata TaxID=167791 RepID=A0ACB9Q189_BAUVA|nr:hypothetical protein L6164_003403 [Bauhinia variegata]